MIILALVIGLAVVALVALLWWLALRPRHPLNLKRGEQSHHYFANSRRTWLPQDGIK